MKIFRWKAIGPLLLFFAGLVAVQLLFGATAYRYATYAEALRLLGIADTAAPGAGRFSRSKWRNCSAPTSSQPSVLISSPQHRAC